MNHLLFPAFIALAAFIAMEGIAWFTHKYVMHGFLWMLHRDHHQREEDGFFERNDFFFLIFAIPGILCLAFGAEHNFSPVFFAGIGITGYGMAYFLIHDVFIHQRFRLFRQSNNRYFKALRRAHKMHHKHLDRHDGECFGMLWVPLRYFREARQSAGA